MTRIVLDAALAARLKSTHDAIELADPDGAILGHFTPTHAIQKLTAKVPFTEEEIKQAKEKRGGRSLAEILADLEKT
jgi:hypothetical protein